MPRPARGSANYRYVAAIDKTRPTMIVADLALPEVDDVRPKDRARRDRCPLHWRGGAVREGAARCGDTGGLSPRRAIMITIAAVRAMTNPVDLTFAAEELGCADHGEDEGAVYGLTCHVQHENVRAYS